MTTGEKIKQERNKLGFSQLTLAKKCNIHYQYLGSIERDIKTPGLKVAAKLAKALDCKIDDLAGDDLCQ